LFLLFNPSLFSLLKPFPFLRLFSLFICKIFPLCSLLLTIFYTSFPLYFLLYSPVFRLALPPFLTRSPRPHISTDCVSPPTKSSST
jgi:hypothetical protein